MPKRDYIDFQDRTEPLAYLITFRTYGTWLHGESRGSIDRKNYNRYGTPEMPANKKILADERAELKTKPLFLNNRQRRAVELAINEVCEFRKYRSYAVSVRTNHVHVVVRAEHTPEHVMDSLKAYSTRKLREEMLLSRNVKPWARHGSTQYLWTEEQLSEAIDYVMFGQGPEPAR